MTETKNIHEVPLALVMASRWQPRAPTFDEEALWELAKSIQEIGLINPIVVFLQEDRSLVNGGSYELVAGERRTRAMIGLALGEALNNHTPEEYVVRLANVGLSGLGEQEREALARSGATITARVEQAVTENDLRRLHRVAVMENIERASLSPLEEAHGLASLQEAYGWSQRELAAKLGKSQGYVGQRLSLLDLPDVAQDAVNTRVLNTTHARALASVPARVAPDIANQVIRAVERGATTREVQAFTRGVAKFLDPAAYTPEQARIYSPYERNNLRLMRHLVATGQADVPRLRRNETRLLHHQPADRVTLWMNDVAAVFGYQDVQRAWANCATANGYTCHQCRWRDVRFEGDWPFNDGAILCPAWQEAQLTCRRFIGQDDPFIISLKRLHTLKDRLAELGVPVVEAPFPHVVIVEGADPETFLAHVYRAVAAQQQIERNQQQKNNTAHIAEIRAFFEWALEQPNEVLQRFHAHYCGKCAHFLPEKIEEMDDAPCAFATQPLHAYPDPLHAYPDSVRAPNIATYYARDGALLPRCERFAYAERPPIQRAQGVQLGQARQQALGWIRAVAIQSQPTRAIWAPLQWLNYERPLPIETARTERQAIDALVEHLEAIWLCPANELDAEFPMLLDCLINERHAKIVLDGSYMTAVELIDPSTGERDQYLVISFDIITGEREWPSWHSWPADWGENPFTK